MPLPREQRTAIGNIPISRAVEIFLKDKEATAGLDAATSVV